MRAFYALLATALLLQGDVHADDVSAGLNEFNSFPAIDINPLAGTRFQYTSGGGQERCTTAHCLCRVEPSPRQTAPAVRATSRRLSVYFSEGSSSLSTPQASRVRQFMGAHRAETFTVVGYTDACGAHEYNRSLARDRTVTVKRLMGTSVQVDSTVFNAESSVGHDPSVRRVDIIAHTSSRLTTMVDKIQADVYLIDASGSMWSGWKTWVDIIAVSFRPGSRVYLSKTAGCQDGQAMSSVRPGGGTEIWYSYWKVLEWMQPGETLAIVSDFRSDVPLTRRESSLISQKVRERNINVIAVSP